MKLLVLAFLSCISLFYLSKLSVPQQAIDRGEVDRIIKTLSSDEMQGRRVFTEGIERAAHFIQSEFKQIGLEPLVGLEDYEQIFSLYTTKVKKASLNLNGKPIPASEFWAQSSLPKLEWLNPENIHIYYIREAENFQQRYDDILKEDIDGLVLVSEVHNAAFKSMQTRFSRQRIYIDAYTGASKVFVLNTAEKIDHVEAFFVFETTTQLLKNVVGMIPGKSKPNELVLFTAHYDHLGILAGVEGDTIANGADDNASGTTAVISLAKYFHNQPPPERSLIFVAFTAEETGGFGAQYFAGQLDPAAIVAMINMEMLGTESKFGMNTAFVTGYEKTDLGKIMQENLQDKEYSLHPDPYPTQNLFYRSDNATFARLGVPAHTISSSQIDVDPFYHTVNDEYGNIDVAHLTNMIEAIALGSRSIVSGKDTPSRIAQ